MVDDWHPQGPEKWVYDPKTDGLSPLHVVEGWDALFGPMQGNINPFQAPSAKEVYDPHNREHQYWMLWWLDKIDVPFSQLDDFGWAMAGKPTPYLNDLIKLYRNGVPLPVGKAPMVPQRQATILEKVAAIPQIVVTAVRNRLKGKPHF